MKAIILSAGQGKRLLPLTAELPKCAVTINGRTMIEWQLDELTKCGVNDVTVVLGYGAEKVEKLLADRYGNTGIKTIFNPFFAVADNIGSCWVARGEMEDDFILLNGDTLFDAAVLKKLLGSPDRPVTVTTDRKASYDADDMKVILDGERLVRIGKDLALDKVGAESIGMLLFRGEGPELFRSTIDKVMRQEGGLKRWYLSVIDEMARSMPIWTCCIEGLAWAEVDFLPDLKNAERVVRGIAGSLSGKEGAALA